MSIGIGVLPSIVFFTSTLTTMDWKTHAFVQQLKLRLHSLRPPSLIKPIHLVCVLMSIVWYFEEGGVILWRGWSGIWRGQCGIRSGRGVVLWRGLRVVCYFEEGGVILWRGWCGTWRGWCGTFSQVLSLRPPSLVKPIHLVFSKIFLMHLWV